MQDKFTIGAIVLNHFGVLNRVSGLFAKRCYNIHSLAVGETENPEFSRMTIVVEGDEYVKRQIIKQLLKLQDVKKAVVLEHDASVLREHMLIKLNANNGNNDKITDMINKFGGKVVDFSGTTITAEIAGYRENNNEFVDSVKDFGIIEFCRAGTVALAKGRQNIYEESSSEDESK